ncbi:hypothetical protein [Leucobacter sp. OH1287]|uniref:hypothetical protein n=1 Tax=Leucobacter sp. OH1287 TaxID=2491049 RepID=UPI0026927982
MKYLKILMVFADFVKGSFGLEQENSPSEGIETPKWEYFVTPLLLHSEAQILNNWGNKGWELVQIIEGPAGGNVAYLKRRKA